MKYPSILFSSFLLILFSCNSNENTKENTNNELLVEGNWHLDLELSSNNILPVDFTLNKIDSIYEIEFTNAEERILVRDIKVEGNKITIKDEIFNSWFEGEIVSPTKIKGFWYKDDSNYKIPFEATQNVVDRFPKPEKMSKSHFGKILSQEIRNKISKNKIDRKTIEITQYDLNNNFIKNWNSAKDVAIYFNKINGGDITKCCKKKLPIAYGYIWRYKNDPLDYNYELPKRQRGKYIVKDFL